jgi:hypothetical protein
MVVVDLVDDNKRIIGQMAIEMERLALPTGVDDF